MMQNILEMKPSLIRPEEWFRRESWARPQPEQVAALKPLIRRKGRIPVLDPSDVIITVAGDFKVGGFEVGDNFGFVEDDLSHVAELDSTQKEVIGKVKERTLSFSDCVRVNPSGNIQVLLLIGGTTFLLSLATSIFFKFHIFNPFVALFGVIAAAGFYGITKFWGRRQRQT